MLYILNQSLLNDLGENGGTAKQVLANHTKPTLNILTHFIKAQQLNGGIVTVDKMSSYVTISATRQNIWKLNLNFGWTAIRKPLRLNKLKLDFVSGNLSSLASTYLRTYGPTLKQWQQFIEDVNSGISGPIRYFVATTTLSSPDLSMTRTPVGTTSSSSRWNDLLTHRSEDDQN